MRFCTRTILHKVTETHIAAVLINRFLNPLETSVKDQRLASGLISRNKIIVNSLTERRLK